MFFSLLLLTAWSGDTGLLEPEETRFPGEALEETVIADWHTELARSRKELDRRLESMGWSEHRRRGDWVIYTHPSPWKPKVKVHKDGWMEIRRRGVHVSRPEMVDLNGWETPLELMLCVVAPFACIHLEGLLVSDPILERQKQIVVNGSASAMQRVADTLADQHSAERLENLPIELDSIWLMGVDPDSGASIVEFSARRAALLERWVFPADNAHGDAVRKAVEDYLLYMVQPSEHPLTAEEVNAVNDRRQCERKLVVDRSN
ncbi:MAG: type II toxin-antitoxin system HicA family toxin [Myxococcota bacterium]|nr:type II toxin-antitoxin system HicA family toxin [Myxococcota bacterium]